MCVCVGGGGGRRLGGAYKIGRLKSSTVYGFLSVHQHLQSFSLKY